MGDGQKIIEVVAAVVFKNNRILACCRPTGKAQAGKWEFPGGKVEPGESYAQALERELQEELNLQVTVLDEIYRLQTVTADCRILVLHFIRALQKPDSEPESLENQEFCYLLRSELNEVDWLDSDREFVNFLIRK